MKQITSSCRHFWLAYLVILISAFFSIALLPQAPNTALNQCHHKGPWRAVLKLLHSFALTKMMGVWSSIGLEHSEGFCSSHSSWHKNQHWSTLLHSGDSRGRSDWGCFALISTFDLMIGGLIQSLQVKIMRDTSRAASFQVGDVLCWNGETPPLLPHVMNVA